MPTGNTPTTPTPGTLETILRTILAALDGNSLVARQHAHNALSTAAWHIARGEAPQALVRLRRAQSHISASMEGRA